MTTPVHIPEELSLPEPDPPRDWFFTFGIGHHLYIGHNRSVDPPQGAGVPVDGYYVVIHGDFHSARQQMYLLFGITWSAQYAELPPLADLPGSPQWRELIKIPAAE